MSSEERDGEQRDGEEHDGQEHADEHDADEHNAHERDADERDADERDADERDGEAAPWVPPPARVAEFAAALESYVQRALGMSLDYSEESLAIVDHYLRIGGDPTRALLELVAPAAGCYFGEVVRRKFGAQWVLDGNDPAEWRLELEPCPLTLMPVGMAACAMAQDDVEGYDGSFSTTLALMPALSEALAGAAPVTEEVYYSLGGRLEALTLAAEVLVAMKLAEQQKAGPRGT